MQALALSKSPSRPLSTQSGHFGVLWLGALFPNRVISNERNWLRWSPKSEAIHTSSLQIPMTSEPKSRSSRSIAGRFDSEEQNGSTV
jgi:hypothetical protein